MKLKFVLLIGILIFTIPAGSVAQKQRLLVTSDIGGDPDDTQSLIRLMLYTCDFEIEGIISTASGTPGELGKSIIRPAARQSSKCRNWKKIQKSILL